MTDRFLRWWPRLLLGLVAASALTLVAARVVGGRIPPWAVAAIMGLLLLGVAGEAGRLGWGLVRRTQPRLALARLGLWLGLGLALIGGLANWALSLQGTAVLIEGQTAALFVPDQLQGFEAGPLGDLSELDLALRLDRLDLEGSPGAFDPVSHLTLFEGHEQRRLTVAPGRAAEVGPLRFHPGAFGYAPRLVVLSGDETLFDQVVPFLTRLEAGGALRFQGEANVEAQGLRLSGTVDLSGLDAAMRGHPRLLLEVHRDGRLLGRGSLTPGRFAELEGGVRVGFAGLKQWSEIAIARRNYREVVLIGLGLVLLSGLAWPLLRRRR